MEHRNDAEPAVEPERPTAALRSLLGALVALLLGARLTASRWAAGSGADGTERQSEVFMKLGLSMAVLLASLMTKSLILADAHGAESIVGVWKLMSYTSRDEETGAETKPWGEIPKAC